MGQEGDYSFDSEIGAQREFDQTEIEIVRLDAAFPVFSPDRTTEHLDPDGDYPDVPRRTSTVLLDTDGLLPRVPMRFRALGIWTTSTHAFTPFEPSAGYQVNARDFETDTRTAKLKEEVSWKEHTDHPLNLYADVDWERMEALGITLGNVAHPIRPDLLPIARALRLHLDFPTGIRLESRPDRQGLRGGDLSFERFHPADTGELASPVFPIDFMGNGLQVALPGDPRDLGQIHARFSLDRQAIETPLEE